MSLRTSARTPVRGRGRVVRRGARGGTSGWAIGSRVVPATAVPEELVNQVSVLLSCSEIFFLLLCIKMVITFCCIDLPLFCFIFKGSSCSSRQIKSCYYKRTPENCRFLNK